MWYSFPPCLSGSFLRWRYTFCLLSIFEATILLLFYQSLMDQPAFSVAPLGVSQHPDSPENLPGSLSLLFKIISNLILKWTSILCYPPENRWYHARILSRKLSLCFHSRFLMISLLKTPDSRRCITSDPISLLRFVYFHIRIRILTLLSSLYLYMMKAVPTGFLFHQLRIIWSFQLCKFCVQWNPLLSMLTWCNRSKLPLTTSAYLLCVSLVG